MTFLAIGLAFGAYTLGWYGYAILQQPIQGGCVGFTDLILPSHMSSVLNCIAAGWGKNK